MSQLKKGILILESGIFACGIGNPEMFVWEIWNTAQGIRNPTNN